MAFFAGLDQYSIASSKKTNSVLIVPVYDHDVPLINLENFWVFED